MGHSPDLGRRLKARMITMVRRYRRAVLLRALYGAASATGTTAVGLVVVILQRHL